MHEAVLGVMLVAATLYAVLGGADFGAGLVEPFAAPEDRKRIDVAHRAGVGGQSRLAGAAGDALVRRVPAAVHDHHHLPAHPHPARAPGHGRARQRIHVSSLRPDPRCVRRLVHDRLSSRQSADPDVSRHHTGRDGRTAACAPTTRLASTPCTSRPGTPRLAGRRAASCARCLRSRARRCSPPRTRACTAPCPSSASRAAHTCWPSRWAGSCC